MFFWSILQKQIYVGYAIAIISVENACYRGKQIMKWLLTPRLVKSDMELFKNNPRCSVKVIMQGIINIQPEHIFTNKISF